MEILLDVNKLQNEIKKNNLNEIFEIIDCVNHEDFELFIEDYERLNDILYENMRKNGCSEFMRILDKQIYRKKHCLILEQDQYEEKKKELLNNNDVV